MSAPSGGEETQPPSAAQPTGSSAALSGDATEEPLAPLPVAQTNPGLPTPGHSGDSEAKPADGFAEFMHLGDASASVEHPDSGEKPEVPIASDANGQQPTSEPTPPPSPPSPAPNAVSFFSGLFARASATLETIDATLQNAQREVSSLNAVSTAQENLTAARSTVTGIVSDLARNGSPPASASLDALIASPPPTETAPLKAIHAPGPALLHAVTPSGLLLVSETALHLFGWDASRKGMARLNITWSSDGAHAVSTPPPPSAQRSRGHNPGKPVRATAAVYLPATEEVVAGHEDGALRIFSVAAGRFGIVVRASAAHEAVPTVMCVMPAGPAKIAVGCQDGSVRVVEVAELSTVAVLQPPEICAAPFGASFLYSPVSCASVGESVHPGKPDGEGILGAGIPLGVYVGYEDGAVAQGDVKGEAFGVPFIAHARKVSGACAFYDGVTVLTIGNEADPSLAVFNAQTGCCLVRRMLPYVPTCLAQVPPPSSRAPQEDVCPSENAFLVGGDEGQLEIFRIVVLSPKRLEVRLVRRVSERVRGRERCVVQLSYIRKGAILMALSKNGELRRWRLNAIDSSSLAFVSTSGDRKGTYNEDNIVEKMTQDFMTEEDTRLSSVGGVIQAQNVLAAILDEDTIPESHKDHLVSEFQKKQADMLTKISQADTELRRAGRRISARFADGLKPSMATCTVTERRLARASKRTAAFEIEFATNRHAETLRDIQASALDKLKILLLNCLKGARASESDQLNRIRVDAERLGNDEVQVQ